ncbi:hypothetical protein AB0O76_25740 [Streptomyces sp. NPDC086554]|uniref:hypothetical protein n=1 Tax=Streptomyces sp. NPDC086554 TaxID=3154864 RepID=UPI0034190B5C
MHRTTTTATLLVSVAVTAVSGCVSVERKPAQGPAPVSAPPPAPRPDGSARPRIVEAPAREALDLIGPPRSPTPSTTGTAATVPAAPPRTPRPERPERPERPSDPPHRHGDRAANPALPALPSAAPTVLDVCALGEEYGSWQPGSPESVICEGTYGR